MLLWRVHRTQPEPNKDLVADNRALAYEVSLWNCFFPVSVVQDLSQVLLDT